MRTRFMRFLARYMTAGLRSTIIVAFVTEHAYGSPGQSFNISGTILPDGTVRVES